MRLANMNLPVPVADAPRIEIVCTGLPRLQWFAAWARGPACCRYHLHQPRPSLPLAPALSLALASRGQALTLNPGFALQLALRRKRRETYPELSRSHAAASWFSLSRQEVAGALNPEPSCSSSHKCVLERARHRSACTSGGFATPAPHSECVVARRPRRPLRSANMNFDVLVSDACSHGEASTQKTNVASRPIWARPGSLLLKQLPAPPGIAELGDNA